jgi:hypothetical protein
MWGLSEYAMATGNLAAGSAATRAAELFLEHRLFRRHGSGGPIHPQWIKPRYPPYWHYDVLQALHLLRRMSLVTDERATDALDVLLQRRRPDGTWASSGSWWRPPGSAGASVEVVDWGRGSPSPMLTLNALRVLKAAARWSASKP